MKYEVSLIATFYNLENYVDRCVASLIDQTIDCEIILVDDGSTDSTLEKLKSYETNESVTIVVLENGGVGKARNVGLSCSTGAYVSFVDGDDILSDTFAECMLHAAKAAKVDLAVCAYETISTEDKRVSVSKSNCSPYILSQEEAIDWLLMERVTESPWAKLFKRGFITRYPFPEGRYYEDVAIAGEWYLNATSIAFLECVLYGYTMRTESIVHKKSVPVKQVDDFIRAIDCFLNPIERAYPQKLEQISYRRMLEYARLHSLIVKTTDEQARMKEVDSRILREMRHLFPQAAHSLNSVAKVARFLLLIFVPPVYDVIFKFYEDKIKCRI